MKASLKHTVPGCKDLERIRKLWANDPIFKEHTGKKKPRLVKRK